MSMVIGQGRADVLSCGGIPRIGERFDVRVNSAHVQGRGEPALFTPALRRPASVYPAIDASSPITRIAQRLSDGATDGSVTCSSAGGLDSFAGGGVGGEPSVARSTNHTYTMGQTKIPAGWVGYGHRPVVATKPLAGLGSARTDFLRAGGRVDYLGAPGTAYGYSYNPMTVSDRAPELGYPAPAASVTASGAVPTARIVIVWKAGTAVVQFSATTSHGRTTIADTIPGNDPGFAG